MSVIIRLQNLPWSANALDIRQYFRGLSIPEGGVHIVGGEQGDAFIAFSTDEDARQAMMLDGGKIKEVKIKLFLSSRAEMQKVIEHARQQSMTLQSFMQMPAPPITAASLQTSLMNQIPNTTVPTIPVSSAQSITTVVPDVHLVGVNIPERRDSREMDRDKKDSDSAGSMSKDNKRDRKERSRSRDGDRRDRKDRDRDRHRDRDRDRERDRRRRDRSRSRERSSRRRDRRDRSRTRERSRSRDHTSRDRERDSKRNSRERKRDSVPPAVEDDKNKDQNGDIIILNTFPPAGKDRIIPQPPAVASPNKSNITQQQQQQQPVVTSASWDSPSATSLPSFKSAAMGNRPLDASTERRLLASTPFSGDTLRPLGMSLGTDTLQSFSRRDPFSATRESGISSLSLRGRESWPPGRQSTELSRFGRERVGNFPMSQGAFNNEHDDFEREMDPRTNYRGGYRGMDFRRGGFPPRDTRLGGPGGSLLDRMGPGAMSQNELDDRRIGNTFPPNDRRTPFRMERGEMDSFQRMDRFDQFDRNQMNERPISERPMSERQMNERQMNERPMSERQMNERQFPPTRPGVQDRFQREKFGTPEQTFEPRLQFPGNCVEIRNMPIEAGYGDIRRFFQGLHITSNGLKLINDNHGNRVGIAYVKFQKHEGKDEALSYNGRPLRGSAVEVLHLNEDIFEKAIDSYKPPEIDLDPEPEEIKEVVDPFVCLCIKELPPVAKESEILKLFTDIPVSEMFIAQSDDEIKQDIAYVKFDSHESAQKALNSNIKCTVGQKPVNLTPCPLEELEDARKRKKVEVQKVEEPKEAPPQPQPAQQPVPQPQPQSQPQPQPQPSQPQTQPQPTPVAENKAEPVQNSKPHNETPPAQEQPPQKLVLPQSDCILLRGLPVQANDRDILDFFSDVGLVPLRIHIMLDKFGKPIGDAFCEFNTVEEGARAFTKNGTPLGKQEVSVKPVLRAEMNEALGLIPQTEMPMSQVGMTRMQPHGREFGGRPAGLLGMTPAGPPMGRMPLLGRHPGSLPPGAMHPTGQPMDAFGNPGCVVSLENIPFRADIDEILDFLADFDVSRENVMRRFTDKGLATGDARVAFLSPSEAQRAIRELRFRKIRGRQIFLKLLN